MKIQVTGVEVEVSSKYNTLKVAYQVGSNQYTKKIVNFGPQKPAYDSIQEGGNGFYDVAEVKEGKYTNWVKAIKLSEGEATSAVARPSPKSTYETPEERAARQVYIVRQSSLQRAIEYLSLNGNEDIQLSDVIAAAERFSDYVLNGPETPKSLTAINQLAAYDNVA